MLNSQLKKICFFGQICNVWFLNSDSLPSGDWTRSPVLFFSEEKKQHEGKRRKNANFNIYSVSVVDSIYIYSAINFKIQSLAIKLKIQQRYIIIVKF